MPYLKHFFGCECQIILVLHWTDDFGFNDQKNYIWIQISLPGWFFSTKIIVWHKQTFLFKNAGSKHYSPREDIWVWERFSRLCFVLLSSLSGLFTIRKFRVEFLLFFILFSPQSGPYLIWDFRQIFLVVLI